MAAIIDSDLDLDSRHLQTLDVHSDVKDSSIVSNLSDYKVYLTDTEEKLLVQNNNVLVIKGGIITKSLKFESNIISCFFTTFNRQRQSNISLSAKNSSASSSPSRRVLAVVLKEQIYVYEKHGRSQVVSFSFHIRNAFKFENGLIISKELETPVFPLDPFKQQTPQTYTPIGQSPVIFPVTSVSSMSSLSMPISTGSTNNEGNFLTLFDALGELGSIVSSSTSSFSSREELISFPSTSKYSIASTYNSVEKLVSIYHVRYLSRSNKASRSKSVSYQNITRRSSRRVGSSTINTTTPSTSKIMDDTAGEAKQYRSTSNAMSYDRMASGSELMPDSSSYYSASSHQMETSKLRKDIIFTKLNSIDFTDDIRYLKIFSTSYQDQEAVVICNLRLHTVEFLIFNNTGSPVSLPSFKSTYSLQGLDAIALSSECGHDGYVSLLYDSFHIVLVNPFLGLLSPTIDLSSRFPPIKSLDDNFGCDISLYCMNNKHYTLNLTIKPTDPLVAVLIESLKYLSNTYIYEYFWLQWCANITLGAQENNDWKCFCITLLSLVIPNDSHFDDHAVNKNEITKLLPFAQVARKNNENLGSHSNTNSNSPGHYSLSEMSPSIILTLHLIREDLRLNILEVENANKMSLLLAQLTSWMGWSDAWFKYYVQDPDYIDKQTRFLMLQPLPSPPNLFESLSSLFTSSIVSYITFSQVSEEDDAVDEIITPRTYYILRLFEVIVSPEFESVDIVNMMVDYGIKSSDLETYPAGVYLPLKNAVIHCQETIPSQWNSNGCEELKLIGRKDLLTFSNSNDILKELANTNFKKGYHRDNLTSKEMSQILRFVNDNEVITAWDGHAEAHRFHVTKLIFHEDRRFYELTKLLQTSKVQTATLSSTAGMDEHEKLIEHRALGSKVALRTLTIPLGRAAVFISSRKPLMTERFPIPKMNFNSLILPDMINVSLEKDTIDQDLNDWGFFHNGCSSGLMISRDSKEINGSWIVFNRPPTLNAQHAGFLLGLGLNGHLKKLEEWHIYNYLGPKHNYTSVGLLLGMAASLRGTMDVKLTKVLSVHVVALLPSGSTNLNVQISVQTAGLIGVGLLYLETQHRRMTEVLLSQISSSLTYNEKELVSEGYRLAAGIALGYIYLGKGENLKNTNDTHVIDQLLSMAVSLRDIQTSDEFDKSCGGSILALTLMFLKTNNVEIATKLLIPKTLQLLDYIRPDFLMIRCLGKNLILWDYIESKRKWVESEIPDCLSNLYSVSSINHLDSDFLPYLNILGGVLLSISIKFASTSNKEAKLTLIYYLDRLMNVCSLQANNYDEKMALIGCQNIRDIIILGLSIIMAGSGDLDTFKRLRFLQSITDKSINYGNYMVINSSLGFLFLGGGQQAFRKDNFGIAALITAIYPVYNGINGNGNNSNNGESMEIHLQALRHFWALSTENRCLIVRDVESKQAIKIEVEIMLKSNDVIKLKSPGLLPELNTIKRITLTSSNTEYFPILLNLEDSKIMNKFKENLTIFVYKKNISQNSNQLTFGYNSNFELTTFEPKSVIDNNSCLSSLNSLSILKAFNEKSQMKLLDEEDEDEERMADTIVSNGSEQETVVESTIMDFKLEIERLAKKPKNIEDLWNIKLIFNFIDKIYSNRVSQARNNDFKNDLMTDDEEEYENKINGNKVVKTDGLNYLSIKFIERLKSELWLFIQNDSITFDK